jgi:hypothetical protein
MKYLLTILIVALLLMFGFAIITENAYLMLLWLKILACLMVVFLCVVLVMEMFFGD